MKNIENLIVFIICHIMYMYNLPLYKYKRGERRERGKEERGEREEEMRNAV